MAPLDKWPNSEKPRERLFKQGVHSLSNVELVALFLRSGTPGNNVTQLALQLLQNGPGLSGLASKTPQELLKTHGLGPAKVSTLIAAFELGRRLAIEHIENRPIIQSAADLFKIAHPHFQSEKEELLKGALLNNKNELLQIIDFTKGDFSQILTSIPQVMRRLVIEGVPGVIFMHNHPSGDPTPSPHDEILTQRLLEACQILEITCHDHMIFGHKKFFSFKQTGII